MSNARTLSGLYFGDEQIAYARANREKDADLRTAWDWLLADAGSLVTEKKPHKKAKETIPIHKPALGGLSAALEAGFRFRFADDEIAGERAAGALLRDGREWQQQDTLQASLMQTAATMQLFALVQPLLEADAAAWREQQLAWVAHLIDQELQATYVERCWLTLLRITGGLLFDQEAWFEAGAAQYRQVIDNDIHPEGYLRPAVERKQPDGDSLLRMLLAVDALSLGAEAAYHAGTDLWGYQNRDVGLNTAVTYLVYYYFYPDKWRWDEGLTVEEVQPLYKQHGAFIEIAASHDYPRGVEILLEAERPFFSTYAGGLTTLSHIRTRPRHRIRWLF